MMIRFERKETQQQCKCCINQISKQGECANRNKVDDWRLEITAGRASLTYRHAAEAAAAAAQVEAIPIQAL